MDGNLRSLAEGVGVLVVALCVGCTTEQGELDVDTAPVVETGCGDDAIPTGPPVARPRPGTASR